MTQPRAPPVPDLVRRDFTAAALDQRLCGDITYLPVGSGWIYLATVIDLCSRRVIGWSIAEHMRTGLVVDAIEAAVAARGGNVVGVMFHSDRGAQYGAEVGPGIPGGQPQQVQVGGDAVIMTGSGKQANRAHAALRALGERANAQLKSWQILRQVRCGTDLVTQLVRAVAVLHNYELASR